METTQIIVTTVGESLQDIIDSLNVHLDNLETENEILKETIDMDEYSDERKEDKIIISERNKIIKNILKIIDDIQKVIKKAKNMPDEDNSLEKLIDVQVCHEINSDVTGIKN